MKFYFPLHENCQSVKTDPMIATHSFAACLSILTSAHERCWLQNTGGQRLQKYIQIQFYWRLIINLLQMKYASPSVRHCREGLVSLSAPLQGRTRRTLYATAGKDSSPSVRHCREALVSLCTPLQ